MEIAGSLQESFDGPCDLAIAFGSFHHRTAFLAVGEMLRREINPTVLLGCTAESVLGDAREIEGRAGLSALALRLEGASLHPFQLNRGDAMQALDSEATLRNALGAHEDARAMLMLADPFTAPVNEVLAGVNQFSPERGTPPVIGGMASGGSRPGHNVLLYGDLGTAEGMVGVTIAGDVDVDPVVSQGCRPIGKPLVVTAAKGNVVQEIGGERALDALQEIGAELTDREKRLLSRGLFTGIVIDEFKDRFGRGDFLIRNVVGIDQEKGAIAVADHIPVGKTIQFHVRDAMTAGEDLQLLLDAEQLKGKPHGGLLFTCNGRGTRLFEAPGHDAGAFFKRLSGLPLAGFFAAGEIGPIGSRSFVHGHTASAAIFRQRETRAQ